MPGQIVVLVATAMIEKNGKYLVLKRSKNNITNRDKWQFPEGKVRFGQIEFHPNNLISAKKI